MQQCLPFARFSLMQLKEQQNALRPDDEGARS